MNIRLTKKISSVDKRKIHGACFFAKSRQIFVSSKAIWECPALAVNDFDFNAS